MYMVNTRLLAELFSIWPDLYRAKHCTVHEFFNKVAECYN